MKKEIQNDMDNLYPGREKINLEEVIHALMMILDGLSHCMEALGIEKTEKDEQDNPVLMLAAIPGKSVNVVDAEACFDILKNFGISDNVEDTSIPGLFMAYDPEQMVEIGEHDYLIGPVIFYRTDTDGKDISVTAHDTHCVQEIVKGMNTNLCANGETFSAFILN